MNTMKKTTLSSHKPIRFISTFFTFVLGMSVAAPSFAIDCAKATLPIEKKICANAGLRAADAKMNAAYTAILKAAPDAEIRAMLVRSQRRWLDARNKGLNTINDHPIPVTQVRKAIDSRTGTLADRSNQGLIALAQAQRKWLAKYTGGPFTGVTADCEFVPNDRTGDDASYLCSGTMSVQHRARVCSQYDYWATYRIYTHLGVSAAEGNKAIPLAFCNMDAGDCSGTDAQWIRPGTPAWSNASDLPEVDTGRPALDAEVWAEQMLPDSENKIEDAWLDQCLTAPVYPPPSH